MSTFAKAVVQFDFADQLALISSAVLRYRMRNKARLKPDEMERLEDLEIRLDKATARVRANGIAELGELTKKARTEVESATKDAEAFIKRIKKVERVVGVVTAVLGLGLAITTGAGIPEIIAAVKDVAKAVDSDSA
jgi:hypothetical protein